jgi:DNA repair protein RecN (Recombination protein N)
MLLELKVQNFAIIDNLHIHFKPGLNILSGETGAGKSVLLKSLALMMGAKASSESIRTGATQASIEGSFDLSQRSDVKNRLSEMGIDCEENILIVRRVLQEEKSKVYLNGTLSTVNHLRDIVAPLIEVTGHSAPLIEMTGQHDNRQLLSRSYHLDLLDQYVGAWDLRSRFQREFQRLQKLKSELKEIQTESQMKAQRLDFLVFQRDEIKALGLEELIDQDIETELKKLKNANRLGQFVDQAESALYTDDDSAVSRLKTILKKSYELAQIDPALENQLAPLQEAQNLIEDTVYSLRSYVSKIEADPRRQEVLESKLSDLRKLQKKFGPDISDILEAYKNIQEEISQLENSDLRASELEAVIKNLNKELLKMAQDLHQKRLGGSQTLAKSVNAELADLNMKGVAFSVHIEKTEDLNASGRTEVEFLSQTSMKDPARPLGKVSSGGELSRILLALKRVVGSSHQPRTYLFDEVDTGVSGPTAEKVGKKLKAIAKGQQVICVTHLAQVAASGDSHFYIQKQPNKTGVQMEVKELKPKERIEEIARLISGEKITKTSLAHAEELMGQLRS